MRLTQLSWFIYALFFIHTHTPSKLSCLYTHTAHTSDIDGSLLVGGSVHIAEGLWSFPIYPRTHNDDAIKSCPTAVWECFMHQPCDSTQTTYWSIQVIGPDIIGASTHTLVICRYNHPIISRLSWSEAMVWQGIKTYMIDPAHTNDSHAGPIKSLANS